MQAWKVTGVMVLTAVGQACAIKAEDNPSSLDAHVARCIQARDELQAIQAAKIEATRILVARHGATARAAKSLGKPRLSTADVKKLQKKLADYQKKLTIEEAKQTRKTAPLAEYTGKVLEYTLTIEGAAITEASARKAHRKKLDQQRAELDNELSSAASPFQAKEDAIYAKTKADHDTVQKGLRAFLRDPSKVASGAQFGTISFFKASARLHVRANRGKDIIAALTISLIPRQEGERATHDAAAKRGMVEGKYPIIGIQDQYIDVVCNNFRVYLTVQEDSIQGKEKIKQVLRQLVDLDALATINAG